MRISVAINTYNHAAFLRQAIESVLIQKTAYPYELFVLDDCSTDGTTEIVMSYGQRYPDRVRPIIHEANRGPIASAIELLDRVPGDYVAMLEGDDYWIDAAKLQTQVDFLEANPDFVLCGHDCVIRNEWTGTERIRGEAGADFTLTTRHLIDFHIPTASMVFRNRLVREWPEHLIEAGFGDRPLSIMLSTMGQVRYFTRPMSVYRLHPGGTWSGNYIVDPYEPVLETTAAGWIKLIQFWEALREYCDHRYDDRILELIGSAQLEIGRQRAGSTADVISRDQAGRRSASQHAG
jgi:glycosyltransferase involved in cell wall biosynthesis